MPRLPRLLLSVALLAAPGGTTDPGRSSTCTCAR
jgi:hypothetical protein